MEVVNAKGMEHVMEVVNVMVTVSARIWGYAKAKARAKMMVLAKGRAIMQMVAFVQDMVVVRDECPARVRCFVKGIVSAWTLESLPARAKDHAMVRLNVMVRGYARAWHGVGVCHRLHRIVH